MAVWGDTLVTGSVDQSARVWHLPSRRCLSVLEGHTGSIWACAFTSPFRAGIDDPSAAPPTAVTGSYDGTLRVWRIGKPDPSIAHGPNGAHDDATVPSLSSTHELTGGHTDAVRDVAWSPSGLELASASWDCSAAVWTAHGKDGWDAENADADVRRYMQGNRGGSGGGTGDESDEESDEDDDDDDDDDTTSTSSSS